MDEYNYKNAVDEGWRVTELIEKIIAKCAKGITMLVVQGDGVWSNMGM